MELFREICDMNDEKLEYYSAFPFEGPGKVSCMSDFSTFYDKLATTILMYY